MNRTLARLALAAAAPLILLSAMTLTGGVASAKTSKVTPTISCSNLAATVNWKPGLVAGTATSKTTQITFTNVSISGCTTTPASSVTAATSITAKASLTTHGNSCESLISSTGKPTTYTFTIDWNGGGGTSKVVFEGSHTQTSPPALQLLNGKATGAFATKNLAMASITPTTSAITALTDCIGNIPPPGGSITSVSSSAGSLSLGVDT